MDYSNTDQMQTIASPVRVNIDLTYRCNLRCLYCHSSSGSVSQDAVKEELPTAEIIKLLDSLDKLKVFDATITGGEVFLREDIFRILQHATRLEFTSVHFITNGTLVDEAVAERLQKTHIRHACISLDGIGPINDQHRGKGVYDKAINACKLLQPIIADLEVVSVITKHNYQQWPELSELLYSLGIRQHGITPVCASGRAVPDATWPGMTFEQMIWVHNKAAELKRVYSERGFRLCLNDMVLGLSSGRERYLPIHVFNDAVRGWKCVVRANGDVYQNRLWGKSTKLGNVKAVPFEDIWYASQATRSQLVSDAQEIEDRLEMMKLYFNIPRDELLTHGYGSSLPKTTLPWKSHHMSDPNEFEANG